jgi:uncharacterized NAD(P)/FAD-binding protein YdhS
VFDTLREQARWIWLALEFAERRKVARRLRPYWDARRFRIAPQVQAVLDRRREEGAFTSLAGAIRDAQVSPRGLAISFQPRGAEDVATREFDAVVIATGPAHSDIFRSQPYLKRLAADGLVALDWVGLGLATDARGRALGHDERPTKTLFVGGPLARGTFGELMGLPEVSRYARDIANEIAAELRERLEGDAPARVARAHS